MSEYEALLRMEGTDEPPVGVFVDLTEDHIGLRIGNEQVADWARDEVRISALPDGFHIRAEGEEIILEVADEARFALHLGLRNAHPHLRRKMSALLRVDTSQGDDL